MMVRDLVLRLLDEEFAICRLDPAARVPDWAKSKSFSSMTRTPQELSIVCPAKEIPSSVECRRNWRCLEVEGPLDFEAIGILSALVGPLADDGISVLAVSTFNTDYLLVPGNKIERTRKVLAKAGHCLQPS